MEKDNYHMASTHIRRTYSIQSFNKYLINSKQSFTQLSKLIKQCNLDDIHCRFNVWRLCLGVVSVQSTVQQKHQQLQQSRKKYLQKKQQAIKTFNKKSPIKQPIKKNPLLMMGSNKPQQNKQIQSDQFLKQQIHKDVERTYQEMKFFQDKSILKLLNLLLFVWCRRNPDVSYKQGMNQLLASVVVCYFKQAEFKTLEDKPQDVSQQLWTHHIFFNSVQHAQSDIYSIFQKIIEIQGDMYKTQADLTIKNKVNPNSKNNTPILQRIIQIKDHKLKHLDLQLFRILKLQDVQTKSFMLRWIRCMHTRQFDLDNSFVIWDSIFLEFLQSENSKKNKQFEFIDAMCLAMFMYLRSIIFTKQTAGEILQVYQKYPALKRGAYLDQLITLAWSICQQLRIQSQNNQASQSNWFEQSSKIKALHFMQKKTAQKKPVQPQHKKVEQVIKKHEPAQKQLKQTQQKKHSQVNKKHSQPLHHHATLHKPKQVKSHNSQGDYVHHQAFIQKQKIAKPQQQTTHQKPIDKHKSTPVIQKQTIEPVIKNNSLQKAVKQQSADKKQVKQEKAQKPKQPSTPLNMNKQQAVTKVPQNVSINLSHLEVSEILQNLNECLPKIRDIDAQSLIRRTIKKIEGKVKQAKEAQGTQNGH